MEELYQLFPFGGYKVREMRVQDAVVRVYLNRLDTKPMLCQICGSPLKNIRNRQRRAIEDMRILECRTFVHFTQVKGRCSSCRKVRLETVDFISHE